MARYRYYSRLDDDERETYDASDACPVIRLSAAEALRPHAGAIEDALRGDDRVLVERHGFRLVRGICDQLGVDFPSVRVLAERPRDHREELHGLYVRDGEERPRVLVWMRTAARGRPVAFRAFLRTLLHETVHHLDYELLALDDSFHTRGFFQRESSLFRQVRPRLRASPVDARPGRDPGAARPAQLDLFAKLADA